MGYFLIGVNGTVRPSAFATLMCVVSASVMRYRHIGLRRHFLNR